MNTAQTQTIRNLVIVGGGTSGWMTAAMLSQIVPAAETRLTVIEPPGMRGMGVGEASIPSMVSLLRWLNVSEAQMMRRCEGTYKLGIQFCDWIRPGATNWHPFGVCGGRIDGSDLFPFWFAEQKRGRASRPYHSYSLHYSAAVAGKGPHSPTRTSPITQTGSWAFHFNSEALASWLRDIALAGKVREISGSVTSARLNASGDVTAVVLENGESIPADFFIDCSGFQSVLLHKALEDQFQSWSDHLLCDRAVAFKASGKSIIPPWTKSRAMPAGWMWEIPLASHVGLGYVYSSSFVSDEQAWEQLQEAVAGFADTKEVVPRFLKMRVGRQSCFWKRNVLAIGLSAGFLEPLESSGLHLTKVGIDQLLNLWPQGQNWEPLRASYNRHLLQVYDEVRDFVQLHYSLNQRTDTPFWIAAREAPLSAGLKRRLDLYSESGYIDLLLPDAFPDTSYYHLLTGSGRFPRRASSLALSISSDRIQEILSAIELQNNLALRELPVHEELLNRIHLPDLPQAS